MPRRPYHPAIPTHRFDIVAYDANGEPILVVEVKSTSDARVSTQIVRDTETFIEQAHRPVRFFLIANPKTLYLYRRDDDRAWKLAHAFAAEAIFREYDETYGRDPIFESYLASLVQVWLNDVAGNWHSANPPGAEIIAENDLLEPLRQGTLALESAL
jgi:hypothetical protein